MSTLTSRVPSVQGYYMPRPKLNNVGSGPNIVYSKHLNTTDLYRYP